MTMRFAIAVIIATLACFVRADISRLDAEGVVRRALVARGVRIGYNSETEAYTVIASAERVAIDAKTALAKNRSVCFRIAELKARLQIMNALGMSMSGSTTIVRQNTDGSHGKTANTVFRTFAERELHGCAVVEWHEVYDGKKFVIALALTWSEALEKCERASLLGSLHPSNTWVTELSQYVETRQGALPPMMLFIDSNGFAHHLGVGVADWDATSQLKQKRDAFSANMQARKNLQLLVNGNSAVRSAARLGMEKSSSMRDSSDREYEALAEVQASGALPSGAGEVLLRKVKSHISDVEVLMVVYGI